MVVSFLYPFFKLGSFAFSNFAGVFYLAPFPHDAFAPSLFLFGCDVFIITEEAEEFSEAVH